MGSDDRDVQRKSSWGLRRPQILPCEVHLYGSIQSSDLSSCQPRPWDGDRHLSDHAWLSMFTSGLQSWTQRRKSAASTLRLKQTQGHRGRPKAEGCLVGRTRPIPDHLTLLRLALPLPNPANRPGSSSLVYAEWNHPQAWQASISLQGKQD